MKARPGSWRRSLRPLVPLYAAALGIKRRMSLSGRLPVRQLDCPVISIGSLSAGGAGKTPMVLLMADMLKRRDYAVRILSRGYGRKSATVERVDPGGSAARFGDEPLLLAQRARVPVYVGADRYRAGLLAEALPSPKTVVHLLDDGFQHRGLARDIDVVLLTREDVEDVLLPAGNLREPLTALRDADVIVLREEEAEALRSLVAGLTGGAEAPLVWVIRRCLTFPEAATGEAPLPARPLAFCGIARPESFFAMLAAHGSAVAAQLTFADHHTYRERDVDRLITAAQQAGADGFLTTEKDAVKMSRTMRKRLGAVGAMVAPGLHVELLEERSAMEGMIARVARMDRRRRVPATWPEGENGFDA